MEKKPILCILYTSGSEISNKEILQDTKLKKGKDKYGSKKKIGWEHPIELHFKSVINSMLTAQKKGIPIVYGGWDDASFLKKAREAGVKIDKLIIITPPVIGDKIFKEYVEQAEKEFLSKEERKKFIDGMSKELKNVIKAAKLPAGLDSEEVYKNTMKMIEKHPFSIVEMPRTKGAGTGLVMMGPKKKEIFEQASRKQYEHFYSVLKKELAKKKLKPSEIITCGHYRDGCVLRFMETVKEKEPKTRVSLLVGPASITTSEPQFNTISETKKELKKFGIKEITMMDLRKKLQKKRR